MSDKTYPVVEVFGPTLQGEGALAGRVTHFVRFGGCDFACRWCDSDHAVLPVHVRQAPKLTISEIYRKVVALPGRPEWVTLSGGNPVLHDLYGLVEALHASQFQVAVETQGSKWKDWLNRVDLVTISPKAPSSGMDRDSLKWLPVVLASMQVAHILKVPVFDERDYEWARSLHQSYPTVPFYLSVVTRMGGLLGDFEGGIIDTERDLLSRYRWLAERTANDRDMGDVTVYPQLHYLIWGNVHGV